VRNEWFSRSRCDREQVKSVVRWSAQLILSLSFAGWWAVLGKNARKILPRLMDEKMEKKKDALGEKQITSWGDGINRERSCCRI